MIKLKSLIVNILIPLIIGGLAGILTMNSMEVYKSFDKPALSPPSVLFPIVWTILYILMGISSYIVYESDSDLKNKAITVYAVQLFFNFIWPFIFFNAEMYLLAFIWLVLLWVLVLWMITLFYKISPIAAYLQIPYILWLAFAAYLNLGVYLLQ